MRFVSMIGLVIAVWAQPLTAQTAPATVTANAPETVAAAMQYAGYPVELTKDTYDDPLIRTEFSGREGAVYFYGCDEETHDGCSSVQFVTGFDREEPWPAAQMNAFSKSKRFIRVYLDDEGDPWAELDFVTLDGVPASVFLKTLDYFSWAVGDMTEIVFAEEND